MVSLYQSETGRVTTYMEALSRNLEIQVTSLYIAKPGEGTWIHPRLAVDFARWISADFAVWMDSWFLEELSAETGIPCSNLRWKRGFPFPTWLKARWLRCQPSRPCHGW